MTAAETEALLWSRSGAQHLTGTAERPGLVCQGAPATYVHQLLKDLRLTSTQRTGTEPDLPGVELLGERAVLCGLGARGPFSAGGSTRLLRTTDGWLALTLSRPEDVVAVPALIESDDSFASAETAWPALLAWAARTTTDAAAVRMRLLGLPGRDAPGVISPQPPDRPPVLVRSRGPSRDYGAAPLVLDFSSLWAGPLCSHLLQITGARVVKVESTHRPDGFRRGAPAFYDLLHHGKESVAVDFTTPDAPALLRHLVTQADVVVEGSRASALRRLGLDAQAFVDGGGIWVSITAEGRDSQAVGFGDDVAAAAGLVAFIDDGVPVPAGDALGDPLTGIQAAAAASHALLTGRGALLDVSMLATCQAAACVIAPRGAHARPLAPRARPRRGTAPASGQHNPHWLSH